MKKILKYITTTLFPEEFMKKIVVLCWTVYVLSLGISIFSKLKFSIDLDTYFDYVQNMTIIMTISYTGKAGAENVTKIATSAKNKIEEIIDNTIK